MTKEWKFLFMIVVIFITACIETDIYLPAFTDMMFYFSISEEKIQALLTWNFVGICASGPLYGPLSDSLGRKRPLLIALGLFLLGSLITVWAQDFNLMLLGRIFQGLGSGGCFTLGTAVIFDAFQKEKAIQALTKINTIVPFIMAGAPMFGGYLNYFYGFRSNFIAITLFVLVSLFVCLFFYEETLPAEKRAPLEIKKIMKDFKRVSFSIPFWQITLIVCLLFAGYLAFLSGVSVLFVLELGVSKALLPYFQAAILGAWLVASMTCRPFLSRLGNGKIKRIGTVMTLLGGAVLLLGAWIVPANPYIATFGMVLYAFGANWVQGLYFPEGMELFPDIKGVTSSFLTSIRLLLAALVVGFASHLYNGTIYPIVFVVCGLIAIILTAIICYERKRVESTQPAMP